tara:strand:- start:1424 stop:2173 length:750 start_codon:yes stop_codon:yes gene_type:complete
MKVSCIIPTYNKFPKSGHLVAEAVESFLRQDYPDKELILFNDCPQQELVFDHPDVLVVNSPRRYRTMGEKLNAAFGLAQGDVLCRFDDDDISLPWRLSVSVRNLKGLNYWSSKQLFFTGAKPMRIIRAKAPSKSLWTRDAFDAAGGFPHMNSGQDVDYEALVRKLDPALVSYDNIPEKEIFYIYRWATGSLHLSGYGRDTKKGSGYKKIGQAKVHEGVYEINPEWKKDYVGISREVVNNVLTKKEADGI